MNIYSTIGSKLNIQSQLSTVASSSFANNIDDFSLTQLPYTTLISSASQTPSTDQDINYIININSSILTSSNVSVQSSNISQIQTFTYTNYNPEVLTVDNNGNTTYISDGTAMINVTSNKRTRQVNISNYIIHSASYSSSISFVSESLAGNISSSIASKISTLTPTSTTYNVYSSINNSTHTYVRNINLWTGNGIDFSCIPVLRDNGSIYTGVLVSPDIMICAQHVGMGNGTTIGFVDKNNNYITSSVISSSNVTGTDINVARLISNVTGSIIPAFVSSITDINNHITANAISSNMIPVVLSNQFRTLRIGCVRNIVGSTSINQPIVSSSLYNFYSPIVTGDSGCPYFFVVNNQLVVLGTWYSSNRTNNSSSPSIASYVTQINSLITNMGSSNLLTTMSLDIFSSY